MYSSQLFYGVQDLPYFFSSSLIVDDCGWFSIWLRPWEEFTSICRFAVIFPQRSWGPHGNQTHIVRGYPGYPRTSLCLITVFGGETTISSWFSSTKNSTIFPWSVASRKAMNMATATRRMPGDWESDGLKFGPVIILGFVTYTLWLPSGYPLVTLWLCHKIAIEAMAQSK